MQTSSSPKSPRASAARRAPSWTDVEELLGRLATTGGSLDMPPGRSGQIESYERGRRLRLDAQASSRWIAVDDIRECWSTFERLGRIRRADVLDPGRCSAFMVALFAQVPGVVTRGDDSLVLRR